MLVGFDDYVSKCCLRLYLLLLHLANMRYRHGVGRCHRIVCWCGRWLKRHGLTFISDYSGNHTKLPKILLNGNNICMVRVLARDTRPSFTNHS